MIRQAHTYLAGAVSGTALIAAAVVAFVLLVSLQALRDWPLAGIGGGGDTSAVSTGRPAAGERRCDAGRAAGAARLPRAARCEAATASRRQCRRQRQPTPGDDVAAGAAPSPAHRLAGRRSARTAIRPQAAGGAARSQRLSRHRRAPSARPAAAAAAVAVAAPLRRHRRQVRLGGRRAVDLGRRHRHRQQHRLRRRPTPSAGRSATPASPKSPKKSSNGVAGPESTVGKTVDKVVETVGGLLGGNR